MRQIAIVGGVVGIALVLGGVVSMADTTAPPDAPRAQAPGEGTRAEFPPEWFFFGDQPARLATLRRSDGSAAPELRVGKWLVGEPRTMASMRGKIVVLDFWGTWCGPCLRALPHTNALAEKYRDQGVEFIAICDGSQGAERAPAIIEKLGLTLPVVMDLGKETHRAFFGQWFPFYVIVDRHGVLRASGLQSDAIGLAVERLLIEQPAGSVATPVRVDSVPPAPSAAWLEGTPAQRAGLGDIEGRAASPLKVVASSWANADPMELADLKGKVVLLDFWGTWCAPCLQSVPKINALREKYGEDGLVVIGVCHSRNAGTMPEVAQRHGIAYPIAADTAGATFKAYRVNGTPDYFLIDRTGTLRFADVANEHVEDAIRFLLAEPAPD